MTVSGALASLGGSLLLAPDAGRFVVCASPIFGEDPSLLDHLVEALESLLEALMSAYGNFRQKIAS